MRNAILRKRPQILTCCTSTGLVYLTHTLDRANLGNAKSGTLEKDLGLHGSQYNAVLILFYVMYSIFNIPASILAKRFNAAIVVPILVICWGALAMGSAGVKGFGGLLGCRMAMGVMEAGFFPCATFYASLFYKRRELSVRLSAFYMTGFIAVSEASQSFPFVGLRESDRRTRGRLAGLSHGVSSNGTSPCK